MPACLRQFLTQAVWKQARPDLPGPRKGTRWDFHHLVLVVLAMPPILAGAYAGVESVEPAAGDAAKGMGLRGPEILRHVELPCALPLIMSGIRSAMLQVIATATVAVDDQPAEARV